MLVPGSFAISSGPYDACCRNACINNKFTLLNKNQG